MNNRFDETRHRELEKSDTSHASGWECWCNPRYEILCDDCDSDGCWKCVNGWVEVARDEAKGSDQPTVMIHNDPDDQ